MHLTTPICTFQSWNGKTSNLQVTQFGEHTATTFQSWNGKTSNLQVTQFGEHTATTESHISLPFHSCY